MSRSVEGHTIVFSNFIVTWGLLVPGISVFMQVTNYSMLDRYNAINERTNKQLLGSKDMYGA